MKRALVCGAGGFIGGHLVERLKAEGYWVRGVDIKFPEFRDTVADEFKRLDLRGWRGCDEALSGGFDEVYQLAADMGGMGYITAAECYIMSNNVLINANVLGAAAYYEVPKYFFSSSVCVYPDLASPDRQLTELDAYPARPDNEYGWEKLYSERMTLAYGRNAQMDVRIGRFQNTYGPYGTWTGGREKAPAAICRKVAEAEDGGVISVWGDGTAVRSYTYVDDLIDDIRLVMQADSVAGPINMGSDEMITVECLVETVIAASGKSVSINYVDGPVGVQYRNFSKARVKALGWETVTTLEEGIALTYPWIEEQVKSYG